MIESLILAVALMMTGQCEPVVERLELESPVRSVLFGDVAQPKRLETLQEASSILGSICAKSIWTQMMFETHDVLLFEWSGSGQDELVIHNIEDGVCIFEYKRGRTRDLKHHIEAFSIPIDISWELIK